MSVPKLQEHREAPRYETHLTVRFSSAREFVHEYASNISAGGMFVVTETPPALDELVTLDVQLPDGLPPIRILARVVHAIPPGWRTHPPGAGVQFVDLSIEFERRVSAYLDTLSK